MITLRHQVLRLDKHTPLRISRGARTQALVCWVRLKCDGIEGWGEAGEYSIGTHRESLLTISSGLTRAATLVRRWDVFQRDSIEHSLRKARVPSAAIAGINQALWDCYGKQIGEPLWRVWGMDCAKTPPTSVTVGLGSPEFGIQRATDWLKISRFRVWKIKMGSPDGVSADKELLEAVQSVIPKNATVSIDANGGWDLKSAITMSRWLAKRGVEHMEQPLGRGADLGLKELSRKTALPILVDESCLSSSDIPRLAPWVDGINIKLMKCGGVSEAIRMIHTARAHGLKVMLGCYSNTALANTAAAHLGGAVDYLDLDSHLNLIDDPFRGSILNRGHLCVSKEPGFGIRYDSAQQT